MSKRRAREDDDEAAMMPPPSTSSSRPVLYYPEDDGHPMGECLAPPSSPPPRQPSIASTSRQPVFGRFSSTGPKRRSALDNIGYVPEDIPTPRTTRPFSTAATGTGKRRRGLIISAVANTSPVRPAPVQPAPSPSKPLSVKRPTDGDDDEYIVDSSDDDGPVKFNLPPEDAPRSKVARTSNASASSRPAATPSSKRRSIGTTPARRPSAQLGTTPVTAPRSSGLQITSPPAQLNPPQPALPTEASPFVSSPARARVAPSRPKLASRISELKTSGSTPSGSKRPSGVSRAFSAAGAKSAPSLTTRPPSPNPGTKRGPGSKSTSPRTKRPRVATPSPPAADDIIVLSSSDDEELVAEPVRRPSPSPSLGDYRPTPGRSSSSDVVLVDPPPPRATTPQGAPRPGPPATPTPSRHSSSSEKRAKATTRRLATATESSNSPPLVPITGRRSGTGRRKRVESTPSLPEKEASASRPAGEPSSSQPEQPKEPLRTGPKKPLRTSNMPPPAPRRAASPPRTTRSPSPPWTGKPLFRPPTTTASGLTPMRDLSPSGTSVRPTPGPSKLSVEPAKPHADPTEPPQAGPSKPQAGPPEAGPSKPVRAKQAEALGDDDDVDPLSALYDEPSKSLFGPPQYLVTPRAPPSETPFSYSHISSVPPPTVLGSIIVPARRQRMECILLPRASKVVRRALEREHKKKAPPALEIPKEKDKKGKGKAKAKESDESESGSEFPSPETQTGSSSTSGPAPPPPPPPPPTTALATRILVIDPQLAAISHYPSLPPDIVVSPERYCHCCRTRAEERGLKMRCGNLTFRRKRGVPESEPHECGLYWCQRCTAKHDIPFDPTRPNFKCPLCSGSCQCDVCRRERGEEPLGRVAFKVVRVKPGKRSLDAFVRGRVASSVVTVTSASTTGPSGSSAAGPSGSSIAGPSESSRPPESSNATPGPSESSHPTPGPSGPPEPADSPSPEPESESSNTPPAPAPTPAPRRASAPGPTTWHGRRTPPPILRLRLASGGHVLSSSTHIFIKRGATGVEQQVDTTPEHTATSSSTTEQAESEHAQDEVSERDEFSWGDLHQTFEGDYSAVGDASFLGADSGGFDLGIEHGSEDVPGHLGSDALDMGASHLGVGVGSAHIGSGGFGGDGAGDLSTASDTANSMTEGEPETSVTSTVVDESRDSTEVRDCPLAYPPSDSSNGSPAPLVDMPATSVETPVHTITGTLDDHPPIPAPVDVPVAVVPDDPSGEISQDTFARIFDESVQGFTENEISPTETDSSFPHPLRQPSDPSEIDELQSTPEAPEPGEPQPATPDLDEIRAAFGMGNPEPTSDIGQLHPEGTFEAVPRISMGDGGDLTLHGSLRDISLFNAVMDCSDETYDVALSCSQTERALTVCGSHYPFDTEHLAIPELEDSESEPEPEPDLVPTTDPESTKSTILDTPSPQLDSDPGPNLAELQVLFARSSNEPPATHFMLPTEEKRAHMRKFLQSQFVQQTEFVRAESAQTEPAPRTTRSQTRKSMMERSKLLRSKRCYGMSP